jgi:multiple sugar transport system permease protein/sn-glycerol 3-phosphate transport system permease protein
MNISAIELGVIEKTKKKQRIKAFFEGMLYLLPSILLFGTFLLYPLLRTIYLSFFLTDHGGNPAVFVGLTNYINLFTSPLFLNSLQVTFQFVLFTVPATIILALTFAVMCNEKLKGIGIFRMIFSSTMGISVAAASMIWMFLFHPVIGRFNQVLGLFGIDPIPWLVSTEWALIAVSISTVWMNLGFTFLILLGGLQTIPVYLYESANIDGCSYFYKLRRITLPMLSPTLFFVVTISLINSFQTFGQIDMLTAGGPNNATNLIVYSIYQEAFLNFRHGPASAQAFVLFLIILLLTAIQFKVAERKVHYQ